MYSITQSLPKSHLEKYDVNLAVLHALHEYGHEALDVGREHVLADWLLRQGQPELARLQRDVVVLVCRAHHHVLLAENFIRLNDCNEE